MLSSQRQVEWPKKLVYTKWLSGSAQGKGKTAARSRLGMTAQSIDYQALTLVLLEFFRLSSPVRAWNSPDRCHLACSKHGQKRLNQARSGVR